MNILVCVFKSESDLGGQTDSQTDVPLWFECRVIALLKWKAISFYRKIVEVHFYNSTYIYNFSVYRPYLLADLRRLLKSTV